ncbi:MAG: conjugal transfer protein TraH [Porticoccaceae bacterium]
MKRVYLMRLAVFGAVALSVGIGSAKADMGEVMQDAFDSMTYTSTPQMADTQRRGVISGGRLTVKSKIMNESLINVRPPSFGAGCGGLDMYGGSFSFINGEQFVQLLRSVAANAKGYAFKLAISAMCETCDNIMETIQKKDSAAQPDDGQLVPIGARDNERYGWCRTWSKGKRRKPYRYDERIWRFF